MLQFDGVLPEEEEAVAESPVEKDLGIANIMGEKIEIIAPVNSPSLDFNDNEDIPTELSDSSETHDEGVQGGTPSIGVVFCPVSFSEGLGQQILNSFSRP